MAILDHLWQSSLIAILIYGLTRLFRDNRASVRHWLWFAASLKFLLPFSLLAELGRMILVQPVPASSMAVLASMRPLAAPFSVGAPVPQPLPWPFILAAIWLLGLAIIASVWLMHWRKLSAAARAARDLPVDLAFDLPIPVRTTKLLLEPGLVGIWRPVILLPDGIASRLLRKELDAVLRHELCHWRRRDNLLAALHMLVEAIFWFHPFVWFIGARLVEERERACDEDVLAGGASPLDYARTILKVCRLYLRSPLDCAAGVSGANLDRRIAAIMAGAQRADVGAATKVLLVTLLLASVVGPFLVGGLKTAPVLRLARNLAAAVATTVSHTKPLAAPPMFSPAPSNGVRHRATRPAAGVSSIVQRAVLTAPAITADTAMMIIPVPQLDAEPEGDTREEARICRPPQPIPGSRLPGPEVCLSQSEWDRIRQQNLVLMPDGRTLAASFERASARLARLCTFVGSNRASSITQTTNC